MTPTRLLVRAAVPLIVTLVAACDNFDWGGAELAVVPPPPKASSEPTGEAPSETDRLPEGPVLYYVTPSNGRASMMPVAEITGDGLQPIQAAADWELFGRHFIAEHLREGGEFTLYRAGMRVGTLVLESAQIPPATVCPRLPVASGVLELVAGAEAAPEFLAMAKPQAPETPREAFVPAEPDQRMQLLAPILAERLLRARGAPLPNNWSRSLVQLKPFPAAGAQDPAFAATFLVDDTLGAGLDNQGYSLFFLARPAAQAGYDTTYAAFTDYTRQGKAAPRVIDFLDWNRDGQPELLLEVYGTDARWFAAVGQGAQGWRRTFDGRCAMPAAAANPVVPDTAAAAENDPS